MQNLLRWYSGPKASAYYMDVFVKQQPPSNKTQSNVLTLNQKRQERTAQLAREAASPEARIRELEADMLRVVEMCMELDRTVHHQSKMIRKLSVIISKLAQPEEEVSSSSSGEAPEDPTRP